MSLSLIWILILIFSGFVCSRVALHFLQKRTDNVGEYQIRRDPWVYLYLLMLIGTAIIFGFNPNFGDIIHPLSAWGVFVPFGLAALIYVLFLLEINWLFYAGVLLSSVVLVALIPTSVFIFEQLLPWWADRLMAVVLVALFVLGSKILNGMSSIFGVLYLTITGGIAIVALLGGAPMLLGVLGACFAGIWLGYLNLNWYPSRVSINEGACASSAFILAWLMLEGSVEFAGPSMLILSTYFIAEGLWALSHRYVFNVKEADFYQNTVYAGAFEKDLSVPTIAVAVAKIAIVNVILACFQLYASNIFSIPLFAFLVNLWLLNMLYNVQDEKKSLIETNKEFIQNVKEGIAEIKHSITKGKDPE